MRASRLGCAFLSWTPSQAFIPRAAPRPSCVVPQQRISGFTVPTAKRSTLDASTRVQWRLRTRHGWQPRLSMSSNPGMGGGGGGMNPESFTERAWEAMVRLPSLADANKAQVGCSVLGVRCSELVAPSSGSRRRLEGACVMVYLYLTRAGFRTCVSPALSPS